MPNPNNCDWKWSYWCLCSMPGTVHSQQFHQPDVTRLTSSSKTDMFDGSRASDPPSYPAAGATAYHPGTSHHAAGAGLIQQFSPSSDSIFRPINQAYMIQSSPHQQAAGSYLGSRDRNIGSKLPATVHHVFIILSQCCIFIYFSIFYENLKARCCYCRKMLYISTVYALMQCLFVHSSVCMSIMLMYSVKTDKHIFRIFLPSGSHAILVFSY